MTSSKPQRPHRINARLTPESARKVAYLERYTHLTTTEVLRESIDRFYAAVEHEAEAGNAARLMGEAGFIGCASGAPGLSTSYKRELTESLGDKA